MTVGPAAPAPSGNGNGTVTVTVAANAGVRRAGSATIAHQLVRVDQTGTDGAGTCTFAIFPVNTTSGPTGGPGAFAIVANADDCGWWVEAHSPDDDWILEDFSQGIGTGVATYRVAPSTEPNRPALSRWDRLLRSGRLSERSVPEVRS